MADPRTVIEGTLKYRDGKKWKPRWCVVSKLSPVADCLHLQLYRDSKDKCKNGPTKASLSLEGFLGMETGFTLDKESNTMALICSEVVVILAFDSRELLIQWQVKVRSNLIEDQQFLVQVSHVPVKSKLACGPARLHLQDYNFCLTSGVPPRLLGTWPLKELRRFGVVDGKFCFEGGSRCGRGEGVHVLLTNQAEDLSLAFELALKGKLSRKRKVPARKHSVMGSSNCSSGQPKYYKDKGNPRTDNYDGRSVAGDKGEETYVARVLCSEHCRWMSSEPQAGESDSTSVTLSNFQMPSHRYSVFGRSLCHCSKCGRQYYRRSGAQASDRSSTDTEGFTPQWTMDLSGSLTAQHSRNPPVDRTSMCSQSSGASSSSSAASSDYSVPRSSVDAYYDRPRTMHLSSSTFPRSPTKGLHGLEDCRKSEQNLPIVCSCWSTLPVSVLRISDAPSEGRGQSRSPSPKKPYRKDDYPPCTCKAALTSAVHYDVPKNVLARSNWNEQEATESLPELAKDRQPRSSSASGEESDILKRLKENKQNDNSEYKSTGKSISGSLNSSSNAFCSNDENQSCGCQRVMLWSGWKKSIQESSGHSFVAIPVLSERSSPRISDTVPRQRSATKSSCHMCKIKCACHTLPMGVYKGDSNVIPERKTPYYANLRFIEALRLYENACCILAHESEESGSQKTSSQVKFISKTVPIYKETRSSWHCPSCKLDKGGSKITAEGAKKRNTAIYELMSYSTSGSCEKDDENYLEMQPIHWGPPHAQEDQKPTEEDNNNEKNVIGSSKSSEESNLPLRPFMPILLPCQEGITKELKATEDETTVPTEIHRISVRSNSFDDLKKKVLKVRTGSADKTTDGGGSADESNFQSMGSPKLTPVKKHTLLSKLTLRSKEKSFSTDEISPPSSVPSTPNNMFLETLHKYPFHKSADCVQLRENFSASDEDLTVDQEAYHTRDNEGRSTIKRSSSAPCKPNSKTKSSSSRDSGISTTLPRRLGLEMDEAELIAKYSGLTAEEQSGAHIRYTAEDASEKDQGSFCHTQAKDNENPPKALVITECRRCHHFLTSPDHFLLLDAGATASSSSSSDISDYIETLSLCSRSSSSSGSSSDYMRAGDLFTKGPVFCTSALRPRSGKEYHMVDRLTLHDTGQFVLATHDRPCPFCEIQDATASLTNASEDTGCKTNSPSPGYVSSSPGNLECSCSPSSQHHFVFPKDGKELNYLQVNMSDTEQTDALTKTGVVQYAVIDVMATAAAQRVSTERAQEREQAFEQGKSNP